MRPTGILIVALLVTAAGGAGAVKISRKSDALEFTYEWPSEAAAIPALDRRFRMEAEREYHTNLALGRDDKKLYEQQQRGSISDFYSKRWTTAGETLRLLSLEFQHSTYTGGAHPNTNFGALLWDRKLGRPIGISGMFLRAAAFEALTKSLYCKKLNDERRRKRGKDWKLDLQEFNECPGYADLAIAPVDTNKNGRFDALEFTASPYEAGPYAEGDYEIPVRLTPQLIAALRPEYRQSFEAQRQ